MHKKIVFFSELNEEAKDVAREWYRDTNDFPFLTEWIEDFIKEKLSDLKFTVDDLKVFYSLAYCQGDGVSFIATLYRKNKTYKITRGNSMYYHEMTMDQAFEVTDNEEIDKPNLLKIMQNIANEAATEGYRYIEAENKNENVDENILANDYTFTLEGERMNPDN